MNNLAVRNEMKVDLKFNKFKDYVWSLNMHL